MKTSNKLLVGTGICIILGIFSYAFVMRGAYQKAFANPLANELRRDLKAMKYLNIEYHREVIFKRGDKFEIEVDKLYKDSIKVEHKGETLFLDVSKSIPVTIFLPNFPTVNFINKHYEDKLSVAKDDNIATIFIDSSFQKGEFLATFQNNGRINFNKCHLDKIDIKGQENVSITIENSEVKQLNLDLPKYSSLGIVYTKILSKNIILGDSCSVTVTGNQSAFLK